MAYLRWQSKVDNLFNRARDIVPVQKRTSPLQKQCSAVALTSYSSPEVKPLLCCIFSCIDIEDL